MLNLRAHASRPPFPPAFSKSGAHPARPRSAPPLPPCWVTSIPPACQIFAPTCPARRFHPPFPARISQRYEIPYTHDIRHPSRPAGIPPTIRMLNPRACIFENGGSRAARRAGRRAGGAMRAGGARACGLSPPQGQPEPARRGTTRNGDPALSPPPPAPPPCSNGGVGHHEGAVESGARSATPCVRFRCRTHRRPALERELGGMQGQGVTWSLHSDRHGGTGGQRALHKEIQRAAATRFRAAAVIWRVGNAQLVPPLAGNDAAASQPCAQPHAVPILGARLRKPRKFRSTPVAFRAGGLGHHPASIAPMQAKTFLRRLGSEIGERKAPETDVASAEKEASLKAAVDRR
ncbi:hypothetical protein B0H14DRAFT_3725661 [Mycena olivaceomarginata]|nr:hypothetical protein B0H14DRAFT_3725661 [Mycena olivaceomarginata]